MKERLDLKKLKEKQEYKGTNIDKVIGKWPGKESIEELLEMRKK